MPIKLTKKAPPPATITKETKESGQTTAETSKSEAVVVPKAIQDGEPSTKPWCEVGVEASYTHNLGDYKSCRVAVHLMVPCMHSEIDTVYSFVKEWVDDRLGKEVNDLQNG